MSGGGGLQLTLSGGQDRYLHFKATTSFFDSYHISYENFSIESIAVQENGSPGFGRTAKYKFTNYAELACGGYLEATLPEITAAATSGTKVYSIAWVHSVGIYLYKSISFSVNSSIVDVHYPQWLDLWSRLTISESKRAGWNDMIGEVNYNTSLAVSNTVHTNEVDYEALQVRQTTKEQTRIILPLQFWWCQDYTQALPVGLLLFSEIYITVAYQDWTSLVLQYEVDDGAMQAIRENSNLPSTGKPALDDAKLYIDYVFLDEASRERFLNKPSLYIIKQVKAAGSDGGYYAQSPTFSQALPFTMPCTTLLFGIQETDAVSSTYRRYDWWDRFTGNHATLTDLDSGSPDTTALRNMLPDSPYKDAKITIIGTDRFAKRDWLYWGRYIPFKHNTCIPKTRGVGVYHFALFPEKQMASGAINLSHADNNFLYITFNDNAGKDGWVSTSCGIGSVVSGSTVTGTVYIYAVNHNYAYVEGGYLTILFNA